MQGNPDIDVLMIPTNKAIKKHVKDRDAFTEIYNRAYEAVMISMEAKEAERNKLAEAVGLMTTLKPTMVVDSVHPVEMALEVSEYIAQLTAERDELREQLAAQETISEIQQMALQDKNSFAELQMRGKLSERITELEAALDKAVETIGSVIGCCTYGSNEEAKQGAYGISHQAFTKIDEFIKYLYNHADIDHTISTDVLMNIKTSSDNNKCIWVELDDPDIVLWATSCGNEFHIEFDKPSDNHMKYCCYCGKEIAEGE